MGNRTCFSFINTILCVVFSLGGRGECAGRSREIRGVGGTVRMRMWGGQGEYDGRRVYALPDDRWSSPGSCSGVITGLQEWNDHDYIYRCTVIKFLFISLMGVILFHCRAATIWRNSTARTPVPESMRLTIFRLKLACVLKECCVMTKVIAFLANHADVTSGLLLSWCWFTCDRTRLAVHLLLAHLVEVTKHAPTSDGGEKQHPVIPRLHMTPAAPCPIP